MFRGWRACLIAFGALALVAGACGKDKAVGPQPTEITGTWTATKVEYVNKANPATRVDLIAAGGTGTLEINADHSLRLILTPSGGDPDTTTGAWQLSGDQFKMTPTGMSWDITWDARLSGSTLTLTGGDMEYDFDGDTVPEQADQNMALTR